MTKKTIYSYNNYKRMVELHYVGDLIIGNQAKQFGSDVSLHMPPLGVVYNYTRTIQDYGYLTGIANACL